MLFDRIKSLFKHTAIYGIGDLLGRSVSFFLLPLYARMLSTGDNGVRSLAFVFIGLSTIFYSLGLNQALVRYLSGKGDPAVHRNRFSSAFWTLFGVGLTLSALLWAGAVPLAHHFLGAGAYADIFHLIAVIILLDTLSEPLFTVCRARQRSATYAAVRLVQHSLQMGLTVYLIAGLGQGVRAIFWSNIASSAFAFLALSPVCWQNLRLIYSPAAVRELLAFGIPFVPSALALLVINLSDRYLIRIFLGIEEVGIYDIVYKFTLPMLIAVRVLRAAWAPTVLSIPDREGAHALCARVTTYFSLTAVFLLLCILNFSRELILLVAGSNASVYLKAQGIVAPILLAYLLSGIYVIFTAGVYVQRRTRMLPAIVGAGAVVNIGINLLLIPRIGFIAAAWSTLAAYSLMALLLYLQTRRFYPVPYEYRRLAKIGVAGTVVFLFTSDYIHGITPGGIARGISLLAYPIILWGWNFFDPQEWHNLRSMVRFPRVQSEKRPYENSLNGEG